MTDATANLPFRHRFVPARPGGPAETLLLLHGTGGNEDDLIPLGQLLLPGATLLSPRGPVLENGMPRFFRRLAEGVFDLADLRRRTHELADFVGAAAARYGFDPSRVVAAGYSNGANIAASTLLLRPETLAGAVLFRAMVPFEPDDTPALSGKRVLIAAGRQDPIVHPAGSERLATILGGAGADVTLRWIAAGHNLTRGEVDDAHAWLVGGT